MGTIISPQYLARIEDIVERASKTASLITGGRRMSGLSELDGFDLSRGAFYPPTVLTDVSTEDEIWQEEVFGPVVVIKRFMVDQFFITHTFDSERDHLLERMRRHHTRECQ
jgi:acyl-CoA reductase-like NAD-dependent aldehyde dehydrogenase